MWKLHRYYLREVTVNAILTFVVLFGIALISLLYRGVRMVQGGDLLDTALTTLLLAAAIFPHLIMFSVLFGTVLTFARASQEREITAIRALGISPRVPMVSALLIGVVCSVANTWALHYEIPWIHYHKYRVVADIYGGRIRDLLRSQDRIVLDRGGVMTWRQRDDQGDKSLYREVTIFAGAHSKLTGYTGGGTGPAGVNLITASSVWFDIDDETRDITMNLQDFYVPTRGIYWNELSITLNLVSIMQGNERETGDRDLRSDALLAEVYRGVHLDPNAAQYTVHRRACLGLIPFLLAPIGFCIGVLSRERGRVLAMTFCMVPLAVVHLADFLGESVMRYTPLPMVAWLPAAALIALGAPFCWRLLRI
ncbi:MAG: LptF/LptG family permease [Planctomycetes bacterium]|nr:LptF/LptG family permease [Planctomycetota bacterium]MCB9870391.1 LptF/LptG family permease [Planctomycetota bacterium]MCB9889382.1 LptF/LptG family permease [Planctomycetota bacterium]